MKQGPVWRETRCCCHLCMHHAHPPPSTRQCSSWRRERSWPVLTTTPPTTRQRHDNEGVFSCAAKEQDNHHDGRQRTCPPLPAAQSHRLYPPPDGCFVCPARRLTVEVALLLHQHQQPPSVSGARALPPRSLQTSEPKRPKTWTETSAKSTSP